MCLVRNLQKIGKNVQNQYRCGSALGTALTDLRSDMRDFLTDFEVKLKYLEARKLKLEFTTYSYFLKVGLKFDLVFKLKCIKRGKKKQNKN